MLPNVTFIVNRNGLGQINFTKDNIMGIIINGTTAGNVTVDEPFAIYSLDDAIAKGITSSVNAKAHKQISEFYNEAGFGKKLWVLISNEAKVSGYFADNKAAELLIEAAKGEICILGACDGGGQTGTVVNGFDEDVEDAIAAAQTLADSYQTKIMPFNVIIPGMGFSGTASATTDLKTMSNNRVSVLVAASENDGVASIGQLLGVLAAVPVQRKASRVKNGVLTNTEGYLTDEATIDKRDSILGELHDKGYIVYRQFPTLTGIFFSGDPTAAKATDDLNTIARNRIIDKVIKIAYSTYVEEIDDDVEITSDGKLDPALITYLQEKITTQVTGNCRGEISNFQCVIEPSQNILAGLPLEIGLNITPKGYLNQIVVKIGFVNPYNS